MLEVRLSRLGRPQFRVSVEVPVYVNRLAEMAAERLRVRPRDISLIYGAVAFHFSEGSTASFSFREPNPLVFVVVRQPEPEPEPEPEEPEPEEPEPESDSDSCSGDSAEESRTFKPTSYHPRTGEDYDQDGRNKRRCG